MQDAEVVLTAIRKCGDAKKPLQRVYRQLYNPNLYLLAYGRIARNQGALTPGADRETPDGMTVAKIEAIIERLRHERYRWTPVRRVQLPKKHSTKTRPLGIPTWSDKLVQEVLRLVLEAYYEPQFSDRSHGFRPGRGCHSALQEIRHTWVGTTWFIEGDIAQCFDRLDHGVLLDTLADCIHDGRFLHLIRGALQAGYLEDWRWKPSLTGSPQGGIVSPILANIYLDRLDRFVEDVLCPIYNRGDKRRKNPAYQRLRHQVDRHRRLGKHEQVKVLRQQMQRLPSVDPQDPGYRRLHYIRYADDILLGFAGPRDQAETIVRLLRAFLRDELRLELSETKTLLTHARTEAAHFLGYEIQTPQNDGKQTKHRRSINGGIGLKVPGPVIKEKCQRYLRGGKPIHRAALLNDSLLSIVTLYSQEYRGFVEYYQLAYNLHTLRSLQWAMETSLTKTLAHKLKISVRQVYRRYGATIQTEQGPRKVLRVAVQREGKPSLEAQWGGVSLAWDGKASIQEPSAPIWNQRTELVDRLLADHCELCDSTDRVQVHHVRRLTTLQRPGRRERPHWVQVMGARRRKTLVVCHACHWGIHAGRRPTHNPTDTGEPDDGKLSRPVRRGADGKVS
jgi:group II intron reverse transcriptase/maturase